MGKSTLLIGVFICCVALVAALDISKDEAMRLKEALNKADKTELYDSFRDTICQAGPKVSTVQFNENTMLEIGPQIKSGVTVLSTRKYSGDNVYSYDELKAAFAAAPEDSTGYCSKTIEDVTDIANNNAKGCSGSDKNVAYMLQSVFTVSAGEEGVWGFKLGVDCNFGSSISVDGVVTKNIFAFQGNYVDFYFNKEFNSASQYGVLNANRYLSAGIHNVEVLCLKGTTPMRTMSMIFSKPHGTFQPYNVNNLAIPVDPQFGMVEFDTNQFNSSSVAQAQIIPTWIDVSQVVQKYLRCLINVEDFTGVSNSNEKGCNGADNKNAYSIRSNIPVGVCDSGDWKFKLKTTFSSGGAMFMDGNLVKYISPETFATNPVLEATVKLAPGTHTLWFVGFTNDVDEPMDLQFARPNGQYQAYTRNAIISGKCTSATVDYSVQLADCQKNVTNVISDLQKCTTQLTTPPIFTLPKAVVSGLVTYESRKYDGTQMLNSQDAIKVWNNAKTTTGCCTKTVKKFELLKNDSPELCGNTGTVDNLAMKIQSTFYVENGEEGTWRFRLGIDYGKGGSMFIDDQLLYEDYRPENKNTNAVHRWWEENWNSKMAGIFEKSVYLGVGIHTLTSFGFEDCCTGRMTFQFAKPGKDYVPLGVDSFNSNTKVTDLKTQVDTFSRFVVPGYWRYESRSFTGASNNVASLLANWNAATPTADTCTSVLPQFTMQNNQKICGRNPGNLGMKFETMIEVLPTEADAVWKIRAGIDFGRGGAMFIDDMPVAQKFPGQVSGDIWWGINWNNKNGVLEASVSLKAGTHTITFLGFEDCCGGEMSVEVAKGSDVYVPLGASLYSKKTCQVYLYKHCNYDGYIIALPPGDYKLADLQKKGFINDDISAIKVERGCWARMYRDYDLTGPTLDAVGDLSCFVNYPLSGSSSGTWNDQVSSVSIYTTTPPAGAKGTLPVQMNLLSANQ